MKGHWWELTDCTVYLGYLKSHNGYVHCKVMRTLCSGKSQNFWIYMN